MNYKIRDIISKIKKLRVQHVQTYQSLLQSVDTKYLEYHLKLDLHQQLARFFIEDKRPKISESDAPEGRIYTIDTYVFTYLELVNLLEETYLSGQLDSLNRHPSPTKFDDPSK